MLYTEPGNHQLEVVMFAWASLYPKRVNLQLMRSKDYISLSRMAFTTASEAEATWSFL